MRGTVGCWRLMSALAFGAVLVPFLPAILGAAVAQQELGVDTFTVSDRRNDQLHARIGDNLVVWQDYRDVDLRSGDDYNADVYAKDLASGGEFKISDNHTASHPDISGEVVVYADNRDGDADVRGYNVGTGDSFWIERHAGTIQDRPAIHGTIVVWQDSRDGSWDIRMKDLASGDEDWVAHRSGNQTNPRISGDVVVWQDDRDGCCDVYAKDLDSGDPTQVTDTNDAKEPDVSGDWVVYVREDGDRGSIYAYNLESGERLRLNSTRDDSRGQPMIDGKLVVWADRRNGEDDDIFLYDLESRTEYLVTRSDDDQLEPAVSGTVVVWTDQRGDRGANVRGATLSLPARPSPTPSPTVTPTAPQPVVCTYVLGFQWLHDRIVEAEGDIVGVCLENEWHNEIGDGLQRTSGRGTGEIGMFAWRKADNWTAWTDGDMTWLWGPCGLQKRPNSGPFFAWEGIPGAPCM
jgi:beta propeller repeat protein